MLDAQVALADMMLNGGGGPRDHQAALALFEKAAAKGHVGATFAMGAMLGGGHDVPMDRPSAQRWFRQAAERGHPVAQMMLGRYLARGLAGETHAEQARHWLRLALSSGQQDAAADLAALPPEPARPDPSAPSGVEPVAHAVGL